MVWRAALGFLLGYLCGSIPFGLLLTRRLRGVDVRAQGSGNIGATNVTRVAGKKVGALVLLLDALKGALPVLAVQALHPEGALGVTVAAGAILGHVFPVWLRFKGGKGVATALGVLVVLAPGAALAGAVMYALVLATVRVSSVGSLLGALTAVTAAWLAPGARSHVGFTVAVLGLLLWTHRENVKRLWGRSERGPGKKL